MKKRTDLAAIIASSQLSIPARGIVDWPHDDLWAPAAHVCQAGPSAPDGRTRACPRAARAAVVMYGRYRVVHQAGCPWVRRKRRRKTCDGNAEWTSAPCLRHVGRM